ncbi:PaaX family transcriptional regulator, partial [Kitasatospora sp. NPDC093558]
MTAGHDESPAAGRDARHGPLITTTFGLYARGEENWLSVASVVRLMGDLGVEPPAVRSSVSRLKRRGLLVSERHAG